MKSTLKINRSRRGRVGGVESEDKSSSLVDPCVKYQVDSSKSEELNSEDHSHPTGHGAFE